MNGILIVGRSNVGKSTLFNRIIGLNKAVVSKTIGSTRDYNEGYINVGDNLCSVIDTAGLLIKKSDALANKNFIDTFELVKNKNIIFFVLDAKQGIVGEDLLWADWLHKNRMQNSKIMVIVNKCEGKNLKIDSVDIFKIGFKDFLFVSAEHNIGINELFAKINGSRVYLNQNYNDIKIAIVGRPNAGKSTLINSIIGHNRMLTSPNPGTTRDSIGFCWKYKQKNFYLIDTPGLRRKNNIHTELEGSSVQSAIGSIYGANIVVLLVDVKQGMSQQDISIVNLAITEGKGLVVAINKCDLCQMNQETIKDIENICRKKIFKLKDYPIVFVSALKQSDFCCIFDSCIVVFANLKKRISTSILNKWLENKKINHSHSMVVKNVKMKLKFITQVDVSPPKFIISCSHKLDNNYVKYLVNSIYKDFDFSGAPLVLKIKT